jgi:hypothetical protein
VTDNSPDTRPLIASTRAEVLAFIVGDTRDWCEPTAACWHDPFRPIRDVWASSVGHRRLSDLEPKDSTTPDETRIRCTCADTPGS